MVQNVYTVKENNKHRHGHTKLQEHTCAHVYRGGHSSTVIAYSNSDNEHARKTKHANNMISTINANKTVIKNEHLSAALTSYLAIQRTHKHYSGILAKARNPNR